MHRPEEIQLREVSESDLPTFYEQQLDPAASQMADFPARGQAGFLAHWTKIMSDPEIEIRTILAAGKIAGHVVCFDQLGEREVGYWLGREFWGRGIATHALGEFLKIIETRPLYAHVARHNAGSRRVLEKCGFTLRSEEPSFSQVFGRNIAEYILTLEPT